MEFTWLGDDSQTISKYLQRIPHRNWMQDLPYLEARRRIDYRQIKWAVVKQADRDSALCAFEEIRLGPIHFIELQRGPLWLLSPEPTKADQLQFAELFARTYPRRFLRRRRWLPNWRGSQEDLVEFEAKMVALGFRKTKQTFMTSNVCLDGEESTWTALMRPKWRQSLKKSQDFGPQISLDERGKSIGVFLKHYQQHLIEKKYWGLSPRFLAAEVLAGSIGREHMILWAMGEQEPLGAILVGIHGVSASYRAGWSNQSGRRHQVSYLLLFEAMRALKRRGICNFDLGGLLPGQADGLTFFKRGLGGKETPLVSVYD